MNEIPTEIVGSVEYLRIEAGTRLVFLLDEYHKDEYSTRENIEIARHLIANGGVSIIGVESHPGGREWIAATGEYLPEGDLTTPPDSEPTGGWTMFADEICKLQVKVVGVECVGMFYKQGEECEKQGIPLRDHPLNSQRSQHFLETLFECAVGTSGNLLLNVGSEHNCHITTWILDGSVEERAGAKASYVRIRPKSYPKT